MKPRQAILLLSLCLASIGCQTPQRPNRDDGYAAMWNERVGHLTYSQMVTLNGPADSKETLPDGKLVGVWTSSTTVSTPSTTIYNRNRFLNYSTTYGGGVRKITERMICTFNAEGVLVDWNFSRY